MPFDSEEAAKHEALNLDTRGTDAETNLRSTWPNPKTQLTGAEKIRAACAKLMYGTTDAEIALILGVTNHGRVNEGIKEVLSPFGLAAAGYKNRKQEED